MFSCVEIQPRTTGEILSNVGYRHRPGVVQHFDIQRHDEPLRFYAVEGPLENVLGFSGSIVVFGEQRSATRFEPFAGPNPVGLILDQIPLELLAADLHDIQDR